MASNPQELAVPKNEALVTTGIAPSSNAEEAEKAPLWRRALGLIWDTADGDKRNRKYVQKLDAYLFTTICLGYFIKYLDQTNYSNAFVSGMKEDLHLYGNERNWLNTWFALGIIIGSVPAQLIQLEFVRPSIFIPCCEIAWSALVMGMAGSKNIQTMYALRFFIGLLEACAFPGYVALLGGWYGPKELTKRVAILLQVEQIASMFSGYLQAGLYTSMNGKHGLAGWRWLFIMDGVISIPIALWGFFGIPDLPHTTRAFYWNKEEREYGVSRIESLGRSEPVRLSLKVIKEVFFGWKIWAFILPYVMIAQCHTATSYFNLWLKASGYSVYQTNVLPTAGNALAIVVTISWGIIADRTGQRYWLIVGLMVLMIVSNIILTVWNVPNSALLFAYYISYAGSAGTPAWGNNLNAADPNLRQLLVATANIVSYAFVLWTPLVLFPTQDAPKYKYGYQILILFGFLAIFGVTLMRYLHKREAKKLAIEGQGSEGDGASENESGSAKNSQDVRAGEAAQPDDVVKAV
ncbi:MFS general substrate transporter [Periconia macrospinosa]|uniref:MFS general substrate transporter n=1 Tax=Periconia macrospinosa TaxID=97972 RepID=A0A2V1DTZ9_9PLEO|nr:MFS general substrate transporter [Periconia macrospinosa]